MKSRIKKIEAKWFRGFADAQHLPLSDKSVVVYGENGSGKSSFVDIVEYLIREGEIEHLRHEYSGRRQEKGVINTHRPKDQKIVVGVSFCEGSLVEADVSPTGHCRITPTPNELSTLEPQKVILRQDEVADFIKGTKGEKYSSLLPLLGLGNLDTAIENIRKIERQIREQTRLEFKKGEVRGVQEKMKIQFGGGSAGKQALEDELARLYAKYCSSKWPNDYKKALGDIEKSLNKKIELETKDQARYNDFVAISRLDVGNDVSAIRTATDKLVQSAEPLIVEKLDVLSKARIFSEKIEEENIQCPACGTVVTAETLRAHVSKEHSRLKDVQESFDIYKTSIDTLCGQLEKLKDLVSKETLKDWRDIQDKAKIQFIDSIDIQGLRASCDSGQLKQLEENAIPVIDSATTETTKIPPDAKELITDRDTVSLIKQFVDAKETNVFISQVDSLVLFLQGTQANLREKIRTQSSAAISAISDDITRMWDLLHPEESIEAVNLSLPADQDKAIEICLKFYGVDQMSPRLTLSEGHRNSLGLCIFLAMAKNVGDKNIPIILDDVVVSFDRNHRGRVADLLEKELADRQILLFTHDREWFVELKQLLDAGRWEFKVLRPWTDPAMGIRWSDRETTLDDARALLETDPSAAGNEARKIMDTWLPNIAEKMKLKMPYLFREKNDNRVAYEFLERIISDGKKCFKAKDADASGYKANDQALQILGEAKRQLASRANRGSHTYSLTRTEASDLIERCDAAINVFTCNNCGTLVTRSDDSSGKAVQCRCGRLTWRYGNA